MALQQSSYLVYCNQSQVLEIILTKSKRINAILHKKGDDMYFDCGYAGCDQKFIADKYLAQPITMM